MEVHSRSSAELWKIFAFLSLDDFLDFLHMSMCNLRKDYEEEKDGKRTHNPPTLKITPMKKEASFITSPLPPRSRTAGSWMSSCRNRCISVVGLSVTKQTERFFMKKKGVQVMILKYWQCKPPCFSYYSDLQRTLLRVPKQWIWVTKESWGIDFSYIF